MEKICCKCKISKDLGQFHKRYDRPCGTRSKCKSCEKELTYNYRLANPERCKAYIVNFRNNNRALVNALVRKSRKKHHMLYGCAPETTSRRNNLQFRLKSSLRNRLNDALKENYKSGSAVRDLGCTIDFLKGYLSYKFQPGMTWENWGRGPGKWQIDHIIPLSKFNLSNREELLKACHYSNLQPLFSEDHILKTKIDVKKEVPNGTR